MFTGIITAIGTIEQAEQRGDLHAQISCPYDPATIAIGASIACSGVCLTVVERGGTKGDAWFAVDVSDETISRSVPGMWDAGAILNLETALKLGDELGGHIVTGHVDAVGKLMTLEDIGGSHKLTINSPKELAAYLAPKGSITLNGASLTVNEVSDRDDGSCDFTLNIIPHTWDVTTLGNLKQGDLVNLEVDTVARYLHRMQQLKVAS